MEGRCKSAGVIGLARLIAAPCRCGAAVGWLVLSTWRAEALSDWRAQAYPPPALIAGRLPPVAATTAGSAHRCLTIAALAVLPPPASAWLTIGLSQ
jgi:hypothetical protein